MSDVIADLAKVAADPTVDLSDWRADRLYMADLAYWDGINRGVVTEKGYALLKSHGASPVGERP